MGLTLGDLMLRAFLDVNRALSKRLERHLPQAQDDLFGAYETTVARFMNAQPNQLVVDVGGGKSCPFAKYRRPELGTRIVAVDLSAEEIGVNTDVDDARVANILEDLPFAAEEVDGIVSRSVLEHLTDLDAFLAASARVLKPGGWFVHLLPGRFAPFAIINRALPARVSRRVLYFFHPKAAGICGFPAFYDNCYHAALAGHLQAHGFEIEDCRVSYFQSRYFNFLFPVFVCSAAYELLARAAGAPNLAAYLLVVARKRGTVSPPFAA